MHHAFSASFLSSSFPLLHPFCLSSPSGACAACRRRAVCRIGCGRDASETAAGRRSAERTRRGRERGEASKERRKRRQRPHHHHHRRVRRHHTKHAREAYHPARPPAPHLHTHAARRLHTLLSSSSRVSGVGPLAPLAGRSAVVRAAPRRRSAREISSSRRSASRSTHTTHGHTSNTAHGTRRSRRARGDELPHHDRARSSRGPSCRAA